MPPLPPPPPPPASYASGMDMVLLSSNHQLQASIMLTD